MKYIINIIFIEVSGLCKIFLDQICSPLDAEHRYVCSLVIWLLLCDLLTFENWRLWAHLKLPMMHIQSWQKHKILLISMLRPNLGPRLAQTRHCHYCCCSHKMKNTKYLQGVFPEHHGLPKHSQSREDGNTPLDCKEIVHALSLNTSLSRLSKVHPLALSSLLYDPLYWEDCTREDAKASGADSWQAMVEVGVVLVGVLALEVVVVVVVVLVVVEMIDVVAMDVEP